ncbi:BnaC08g11520D [Brassica napus]|uniref:BnaC08g11520D protein n=1 Tax=Brassica napus TaxID=3708 RepID=A0A078F753_BRANA|nr:BnaC08g11520D [Brassica napus]
MIHGPCGVSNQKSPCMENNSGYVLYHNTFVCSEVSFQVHNQGYYIDAWYVSACEKPSVEKLIIHLEGEHNITIKSTDNLGRVIRKPGIEKTIFTEWMVLCRRSEFARTLTYVQIPEYFVWNNTTKVWSERKKGKTIGRIMVIKVCHARGYLDNDVE